MFFLAFCKNAPVSDLRSLVPAKKDGLVVAPVPRLDCRSLLNPDESLTPVY